MKRAAASEDSHGQEEAKCSKLQERQNLPIYQHRQRLIQAVRNNKNIVLISSTGSGKTTQLPQFLVDANINKSKIIAITQPRRIAAISVAQRVAVESECEVGQLVGYSVRFEECCSPNTRLKFLTDGMLIREAIADSSLKSYSVIVLDEAHERTLNTDLLFGVVKNAQKKRLQKGITQLKVIVMSATIDPDIFVNFLGAEETQVIYVEGRRFPLRLMSLPAPGPVPSGDGCTDYVLKAANTCLKIHKQLGNDLLHSILIFLTGEEEIERCCTYLRQAAAALSERNSETKVDLVPFPLYGALPQYLQNKTITTHIKNVRKVIVSTNIAETSLTIPQVKTVIDCGFAKTKSYNPITGIESLRITRISKAQAWQRAGRANRESAGFCYRLYNDADYHKMSMHPIPELQRCDLASVILQLVAMGIQTAANFEWLSPPSEQAVNSAIDSLTQLDAVEHGEIKETLKLTTLGQQMVRFPLPPRLSRVVMKAAEQACLVEVLTVCSMLYVDSVFYTPAHKKENAQEAWEKFHSSHGDLHTLLNVFRGFMSVKERTAWCRENFINFQQMQTALKVRKQLKSIAQSMDLALKSCHDQIDKISKCFLAGYHSQVARLDTSNNERIGPNSAVQSPSHKYVCGGKVLLVHPSSSLFNNQRNIFEPLLFIDCVETSQNYMRHVCRIKTDWMTTDGAVA